jgi:DNA-binding NarL/FixJ family response regulator
MLAVIVTDNGFAAEAIRRALRNASGIQVAGYIDGRRSCASAIADTQPDVVVVDQMTWSACAVERIRELRTCAPEAKIIALVSEPGAPWLSDAVAAGAHAAIAKTVQPATLGALVRDIWAGNVHHAFESPQVLPRSSGDHRRLTSRELEILVLVASGTSNAEIARQLWVTEQTVKFHLSNVYRKLGVSNRTQASHFAHMNRLVGTSAQTPPAEPEAA